MSYQNPISELIKARRTELGWSQRDLAGKSGLKQPHIARIESGADIRLSTLLQTADALGLELGLQTKGPVGATDEHPMAGMQETWPESDRDSFAVFVHVQRVAELFGAATERLAAVHGMTSGELSVLGAFRRLPEPHIATPTELRRYFWLTLPGVVRRIAKLVDLGFVAPVDMDGDRRRRHYRLTDRGCDLIDGMVRQPTPEFLAVASLPPIQRGALRRALEGLVDDLEAVVAGVDYGGAPKPAASA